jgi:RNA polymerase sigma-70 factor (ECF subfamily)
MPRVDVGSTSRSQIEAIRDWGNQPAWLEFHKRYDPLVRRCLAHLRLDHAAADEVCQETWVQIANRMRSFVYDPAGSFRGWVWKVAHHEAVRFLTRRARERMFSLDERDDGALGGQELFDAVASLPGEADADFGSDNDGSRALAGFLREAEEVQAAVRRAVKPHTWEAFWLVGVALWTVDATASHIQISPASVIKAKGRVTKMLQREARRRGLETGDLTRADHPKEETPP